MHCWVLSAALGCERWAACLRSASTDGDFLSLRMQRLLTTWTMHATRNSSQARVTSKKRAFKLCIPRPSHLFHTAPSHDYTERLMLLITVGSPMC